MRRGDLFTVSSTFPPTSSAVEEARVCGAVPATSRAQSPAMMRKKDGREQRRRAPEQHGPTTMEEENDACILDLESRVQSLKHLSLAMRDEVQESNELLEGMSGSLEGVQASIRSSIRRMENLWKQGGGWHTCYLALFVIFIFLLFYFLYGKSRS